MPGGWRRRNMILNPKGKGVDEMGPRTRTQI